MFMHDLPDAYYYGLNLRTVSHDEWVRLHKQIIDRAHRDRNKAIWAALGRLSALVVRLVRSNQPHAWVSRPRFGRSVL
jgi:hypothetical protein